MDYMETAKGPSGAIKISEEQQEQARAKLLSRLGLRNAART